MPHSKPPFPDEILTCDLDIVSVILLIVIARHILRLLSVSNAW